MVRFKGLDFRGARIGLMERNISLWGDLMGRRVEIETTVPTLPSTSTVRHPNQPPSLLQNFLLGEFRSPSCFSTCVRGVGQKREREQDRERRGVAL